MTTSESPSYARFLAVFGSLDMVAGVLLFLVGRPGNAGLPIAGAGLFVLILSAATAATRRR